MELSNKLNQLMANLQSTLQASMANLQSVTTELILIMLVELGKCCSEIIVMLNAVDAKHCTANETLDAKLTALITELDTKFTTLINSLDTNTAATFSSIYYTPGTAFPTYVDTVAANSTIPVVTPVPESPVVDHPTYTNTHAPTFVAAMPFLTTLIQKIPGMITNTLTGIFKQVLSLIDKLGIPESPDKIKDVPTENSDSSSNIVESNMSLEDIQKAELADQYGIS